LNLCDSGREYGLRHYFYGGAPGVAEELTRRLCDAFPGLEVVGRDSPPFRPLSAEEDAAAIARINEREPDVLWVGLGAPKQERWMADHVDSVQVPIMIGVGAAFDFHSGNIKWAPRWIRLLGMEWAYRLVRAPGRLWKRNLDSPLFLFHVLLQKLRPPAFRQMAGDGGDEGDFLNLPLDGVEDGHANVLIVGVGRRSELFLRELESLPEHTNRRRRVVGLLAHGTVERSPSSVNGHRVLGNVACLGSLLNSAEIAEVVVTESLAAESLQEIVDTCSSCNVRVTSWQLESRTLSAPTL
jgi:exopolysaccharide biosynthesis WecB/TagA/CpsF family protein